MAEVNDIELAMLRKSHSLLDSLWSDPKTGITVKKMVEQKTGIKSPELALIEQITAPQNEAIAKVTGELESLRAQRDAEKKAAEERAQEEALRRRIESVKKEHSFTDEGMEKVFARMREMTNPDVESAAAYVLSKEPKAKPVVGSPYAPQSFNLYGSQERDEKWAALNENPMRFFDNEVANVLNEFANA